MPRLPVRPLHALLLACALTATAAFAQPADDGFDPRTGDAWVDTWLADINRYGDTYRDAFVDELVRYHGVPRGFVVELLTRPGWTPGDVYFACSLAGRIGRPCRYVAEERDRDGSEGWGAVAQRLGVKPGSPGFHAIKRGFVPTYQRWARPIRLEHSAGDHPGPERPPSGQPDAGAVGKQPVRPPPAAERAQRQNPPQSSGEATTRRPPAHDARRGPEKPPRGKDRRAADGDD